MDYDGTLAEIQKNVNNTYPEENVKKLLATMLQKFKLYIVTGRNVSDVKQRLGLDKITVAGSMGHQIVFADGKEYIYPLPEDIKNNFTTLRNDLKQVCLLPMICSNGVLF